MGEWVELTYVFKPGANTANVDWEMYLNGDLISKGSNTNQKSEFVGMNITDFRIKFKNTRCYDEVIILFDDTTLEMLPYAPAETPAA